MPQQAHPSPSGGIVFMVLSALIFGYFGFTTEFITTGTNGEFLWFVAILEWTLKGGAIVFALSAGLSLAAPRAGAILYATAGLAAAILMVVVALLDWLDPVHMVMHPFLLLLFAAWNGYGSYSELMSMRGGAGGSGGAVGASSS